MAGFSGLQQGYFVLELCELVLDCVEIVEQFFVFVHVDLDSLAYLDGADSILLVCDHILVQTLPYINRYNVEIEYIPESIITFSHDMFYEGVPNVQ